MAWRFTTSSRLTCSIGGLDGTTVDEAFTVAMLLKTTATGATRTLISVENAANTDSSIYVLAESNDYIDVGRQGSAHWCTSPAMQINTTTDWWIVALTVAGNGTLPRFHMLKEGSSWSHGNANGGDGNWDDWIPVSSTSEIVVGALNGTSTLTADVTIAGLKYDTTSDGTIETLGFTGPTEWDALFTGADAWAVGFDDTSSRTDRTGGGGDEVSRGTGETLVSDPSGWSWGAPVAEIPYVHRSAMTASVVQPRNKFLLDLLPQPAIAGPKLPPLFRGNVRLP